MAGAMEPITAYMVISVERFRHRITEILRANPGSTEVVFADSTTGKKYIAPKELFVNRNPRLMAQLTALLGEKNIALVQKKD